ncbi:MULTISPECIES: sensor histidine kinase [Leuconostoc]|uniref:histidine kinase n=1 Tax=Leuconostoc pseudomesenteroides TaxID=33968 RepID=A0A1X0VDA7_LEUPS|nr:MULTISPECIES: HAMP domain-containing sensor histidine kinase [Leuconostoc]MCT4378071.1 sensor histidine kinase [Leuconostoc falkenbergense]MCT4418772.1 sensor histidine kinase [Leuconostoc falkenbergense]MDG9744668.1 HAMP domain-containing sensor histidine kinase [Leuconostoc falkenbergense]MDI6668131.1 HAMP domain-containing sensor histidine kinase [Leuconostoc falkenbergense]MDV8952046.1 GHKL domain-containing protein [Leuconostoc falkenbergense]
MKKIAIFFKHNRTKNYYIIVTLLLLCLYSWTTMTGFDVLAQRVNRFSSNTWQILEFFVFVLGNFAIIIVQYVKWRRDESLLRLIRELRQISADNADMTIDWHATYAPKTQALIDVSNTIATNTRRIREEERASERSKDEMITNISHDLRTPLTAIIGYLGLVEMGDNLSDDNRKKYIHTAYDKSNQMKVLVEDLFEFSKTQAQDASLNLTSLSLSDLFGQLLASYELEAQEKNIKLTQLTNPEMIVIEADSDKLARVLMNLITNAFKYGDGATFIKLTAQVRDENVEIRVINDGAKIPGDALDDIFDRFYRVESSRNSKTGGTGLGLAIVKGIVTQHHGVVSAESDDDLTTFVISLPLKQKGVSYEKIQN